MKFKEFIQEAKKPSPGPGWESSKWWPKEYKAGLDPAKIAFDSMIKDTQNLFPKEIQEWDESIWYGGNTIFDSSSIFLENFEEAQYDWLYEYSLNDYYNVMKNLAEAMNKCKDTIVTFVEQALEYYKKEKARLPKKSYQSILAEYLKLKVPTFTFSFSSAGKLSIVCDYSIKYFEDNGIREEPYITHFSDIYLISSGSKSSMLVNIKSSDKAVETALYSIWNSLCKEVGKFTMFTDALTLKNLVTFNPPLVETFNCVGTKITSLEGVPSHIDDDFNCDENELASLDGVPQIINGNASFAHNKIETLKGIEKKIKQVDGYIDFSGNPIKSHLLGLLQIKGLRIVYLDDGRIEKIMRAYLPEGDIFDCQSELIDAGFEEYAQL